MAFCRFCGKQLEDGEVCSCQRSNPQVQYQPYVPETNFVEAKTDKSKVKFDPFSFLKYVRLYFINPNEAARNGAKNKDFISMIICGMLFVFANALSQTAISENLDSSFNAVFAAFGALFGIFGILYPAILYFFTGLVFNGKQRNKHIITQVSLHTPYTSIFLILAFVLGKSSLETALVFYILAIIVYSFSMVTVMIDSLPNKESILRKISAFIIALLFIITLIILIFAEISINGPVLEDIIVELFGKELFNGLL